jgi:hypothetical protein
MITNVELENYLHNYDASEPQNYKFKDLFSKDGRERITEEIKDKHPKVKKALDKHPILEKAVKTALAYEAAGAAVLAAVGVGAAVYFGGGAIAGAASAAGTGAAASGGGIASGMAVFKPAMQAILKGKGEQTNGLSLKDIAGKFMKANGKKSKNGESDFAFISDYFAEKMNKAKRDGASAEDKLINNLIDGTANAIGEKGASFLKDLITGNDAAPDTPLAPAANKKDEETPGMDKKNLYLILGAIVLIVILARK